MEENSQSDTQYIPYKEIAKKEQQNIIIIIKKK